MYGVFGTASEHAEPLICTRPKNLYLEDLYVKSKNVAGDHVAATEQCPPDQLGKEQWQE